MNLKTKLTLIAILFFNVVLIAQNGVTVKGTVTGADNIPIPGVNVIVERHQQEPPPILTEIIKFKLIKEMYYSFLI